MTYRRLRPDELEGLEDSFARYLALNGVPAEEWARYKREDPDKVGHHLDVFSDLVFEQTLATVVWLELKTPRDLRTFHCLPDRIEMAGLFIEGESALDFTHREATPEQMVAQLRASGAKLKLYRAERTYRKARNLEIFDLMEQGALISKEGQLFNMLVGLGGQ